MADETFAEKTEPATPRRRGELRRDGKVVKSMELNSALGLLGGSIVIYMLGRGLIDEIADVMKQYLSLSLIFCAIRSLPFATTTGADIWDASYRIAMA